MNSNEEYGFYASDITRTWPVNGKFTTSQSAIYEIVLDCQKVLISNCIAGKTSLDSLQDYTFQYFKTRLSQLFKRKVLDTEMVDLYPHHVGHYIGLDVHDCPTISRSLKLHGGMCITIEPGLYIPNDAKYGEFAGIGVRIEDDVVVTDSEPLVLSAECVKEIEDIEALMK